jgi:hypothetical protein
VPSIPPAPWSAPPRMDRVRRGTDRLPGVKFDGALAISKGLANSRSLCSPAERMTRDRLRHFRIGWNGFSEVFVVK